MVPTTDHPFGVELRGCGVGVGTNAAPAWRLPPRS
jgi:hypothetical protein